MGGYIVRVQPNELVEELLKSELEVQDESALEIYDNDESADETPQTITFEIELPDEKSFDVAPKKGIIKNIQKTKQKGSTQHGQSNNPELERD